MAAITASMVAELRAKTDAPMMECKKALTEAEGDFDKAEELLRVKLGSKAGKAASRVTAEGVVAAAVDGTTGALVEVNCETDFVSKNDDFLAFSKGVAELVAKSNPADVAALPDAMFVIDVGYHKIAVAEAKKLGIPVIGIVDTNHSPVGIDYVIPGNDDSAKAVALYARMVADAVLEGKANSTNEVVQAAAGSDEFVEVREA